MSLGRLVILIGCPISRSGSSFEPESKYFLAFRHFNVSLVLTSSCTSGSSRCAARSSIVLVHFGISLCTRLHPYYPPLVYLYNSGSSSSYLVQFFVPFSVKFLLIFYDMERISRARTANPYQKMPNLCSQIVGHYHYKLVPVIYSKPSAA